MEEAKLLKRGVRANTYSKVFIVIQFLVCFSLICNLFEDEQSWPRFSENASIALTALVRFDVETLGLIIAYLIGFNFIANGALILAFLAWLRYKNEEARPTVVFATGVIVATSLIALASLNFFSLL